MPTLPEWMAPVETVTFLAMVATVIYNRLLAWKRIDKRTNDLEVSFVQYQRDMQHYLSICELCRGEVRKHHEDETERHVTADLRQQVQTLVEDVRAIKQHLMEYPRASRAQ